MGSGQSQAKPPEAPGFIPRSGNRIWRSFGGNVPNPDHSLSEQRFITVGISSAGRVLVVAHVDRSENIRIISARKATQGERRHYEEKD
jgi:uncharacterized DUF497 family protein